MVDHSSLPPLTPRDKLEIMTRVCGSLMSYSAQRLLDGERVVTDNGLVDYTPETYLAKFWQNTLESYGLLRHKKGGVYRKTGEALDSSNSRQLGEDISMVIYEHVWPHARQLYVRPKAEFEEPGRFVRITD